MHLSADLNLPAVIAFYAGMLSYGYLGLLFAGLLQVMREGHRQVDPEPLFFGLQLLTLPCPLIMLLGADFPGADLLNVVALVGITLTAYGAGRLILARLVNHSLEHLFDGVFTEENLAAAKIELARERERERFRR